jgi:hypothetical protein
MANFMLKYVGLIIPGTVFKAGEIYLGESRLYLREGKCFSVPQNFQTGAGTNSASYSISAGVLPRG